MTRDVMTLVGTRFASLIMVTALIAACGSQTAAGPPASVVTGVVAAGPVAPGARPGSPATRPAPGATVEALQASQVIAATRTDEAGGYQFRLQPGTYVIRARSDKYLSREKRRTVTLSRGQKITVNFVLDTGIR